MRRVYQVAALVIFALAVYVAVESRTSLNYYTEYGPGSGFFSFWCGVLMIGLSATWFLQVTLRPVEGSATDLIPYRQGAIRVISVLVSLVVFALLVGYLGFTLTMFAFLLILFLGMSQQKRVVTLALSIGLSVGMTYLFRSMLDVQLPFAGIEFLANLGL